MNSKLTGEDDDMDDVKFWLPIVGFRRLPDSLLPRLKAASLSRPGPVDLSIAHGPGPAVPVSRAAATPRDPTREIYV